jgi:hypothetical protein
MDQGTVLQNVLELSKALLEAADRGDAAEVTRLDGERLRLLKSMPREARRLDAGGRSMLREIAALNDQAIGRMEHRRRAVERDMDMLSARRRAVHAYASAGLQR